MNKICMRAQDLLELYQLAAVYKAAYLEDAHLNLPQLLERIENRYKEISSGKDIRRQRNPRQAGRKQTYSQEQNEQIYLLRQGGKSIRKIAEEAGCSTGHVQDVIRKARQENGVC